jgi:hypothetical protein
MSLTFDGVDDMVARSASVTLGAVVTLCAWIKPTTYGEGRLGAIWQHGGAADVARLALRLQDAQLGATASWGFAGGRATTTGRWIAPDNQIALGVWQWLAASYDGTATANNPTLYYNGAPVTVTRIQAPAGALLADTQVIYLGNAGSPTRTFEGAIGEVGAWTRVLSDAELAAVYTLGVNAVPDYVDYLPWDSGSGQVFGAGGSAYTITGALAGENPPIRPAGRRG